MTHSSRLRAVAAGIVIVPAMVALAACGSVGAQGTGSDQSAASSPSSSESAAASGETSSGASSSAPSAAPDGPEVPADSTVADPVPRDQMPTATGRFGDKPTISVPEGDPPDSLQRVILEKGDGPTSKAGDTVVVNYLGKVWGGKVFDNSYDRDTPFTLQVGSEHPQVVAGWNVGLQGVKQGSRVMLSLPPRDGYGKKGSPPKIGGDDTLIFVVDVLKVYSPDVSGAADATPQDVPAGWPTVGGKIGGTPTVTVPSSLLPPEQAGMTVIAAADGPPAEAGTVLVQYVASSWDGSRVEQSWPDPSGKIANAGSGPMAFSLDKKSPFSSLIGVPIGSRVLVRTPKNDQSGAPALAWVMDLIAQQSVSSGSGSSGSGSSGSGSDNTSGSGG